MKGVYVTVGAQMPFDRLVGAVDRWAKAGGRTDVLAQIGERGAPPRHVQWRRMLSPDEHRRQATAADLLVAHAGTGSILTALELGKPILVMPRRADLRETRNDHQLATVERFRGLRGVTVALDENELLEALDRLSTAAAPDRIGPWASERLIARLHSFIHHGAPGADDTTGLGAAGAGRPGAAPRREAAEQHTP